MDSNSKEGTRCRNPETIASEPSRNKQMNTAIDVNLNRGINVKMNKTNIFKAIKLNVNININATIHLKLEVAAKK